MKLRIPHITSNLPGGFRFLEINGSIKRMDNKFVLGSFLDTSAILTTSQSLSVFGYFDYFLSPFCTLGIVYEDIALYMDMLVFLKTFNDKKSLFRDYHEV